jgi:hypothetical protein
MRHRTELLTRALLSVAALALFPSNAQSQTSTGALTVTATVAGSIGLTFENDVAGVALTGAGTNTATLAFGTVSAYGTIATGNVTRTRTASDFTVSSPFGVNVVLANSASTDYTLDAKLAAADAVNTWTLNATALTTTYQTLGAAYGYGSAVAHTVYLTVPFSAAAGAVSKVIDMRATAN